MAAAAARSVIRGATIETALTKLAAPGARPARPTFRFPKQRPLSHLIFRSPLEMSCSVESLLPYHTATASALFTSMLSVSPRRYGWTLEDCSDDV